MNHSSSRALSVIQNHYNRILRLHKRGPKAVGWGSRTSQEARFFVLSELGDLEGKTILDVGCGFGDLYGYIAKKKIRIKRYLGVDTNIQMIAKAAKRYPSAEFQTIESLQKFSDQSFDYVVESGIFNLQIPSWKTLTLQTLKEMYRICKKGIGANFLSALSPFPKDKASFYADPFALLRVLSKSLTPKIVLRHEYKPNDFTLFLYR